MNQVLLFTTLKSMGINSVGFRSPAGVRIPPLHQALRKLNIPLVHWSVRFYDTSFMSLWRESLVNKSIYKTKSGSIVMLHDSHSSDKNDSFLSTLNSYLQAGADAGICFKALPHDLK
jgi:hypothetical protein